MVAEAGAEAAASCVSSCSLLLAGERPYLCSLCGKTFTESCKLKRHLTKVHKANKDGSELIPGQPVINTGKRIVRTGLKAVKAGHTELPEVVRDKSEMGEWTRLKAAKHPKAAAV